MAGVRLRHPTYRNAMFVVELEVGLNRPHQCPVCSDMHAKPPKIVEHNRKAVHLRLDGEGTTIVSPEVLASLQTLPYLPLEVESEVEKPPEQVIGAVDQPKQHIISLPLGAPGPHEFYRPERRQYEFQLPPLAGKGA